MKKLVFALALFAGACTSVAPPIQVSPVDDAELRSSIAVLASDSFEGRMSGTPGERKTIEFLVSELRSAGVEGGMKDGGYLMPFPIAAQSKPVPSVEAKIPAGQLGFIRAMNAAGPVTSHNVVGRIRGRHSDGKVVLVMAHWDHLGICRPDFPADRICNGAVDNASGTAAVLAVARRVAKMRLDRDVWFVLTGAEEWGLLGAKAFASRPPLPLRNIVAGFNLDTIAIAPSGMPVAMVAEENSPLVTLVEASAKALGRGWDGDDEAAGFLKRQDGWALAEVDVPMIMAGGSFSDMSRLQAFLSDGYHSEHDELGPATDLGGAVDDANLHVELVRRAASRRFRPVR